MSNGTYMGNHSIAIEQLHKSWKRIEQLVKERQSWIEQAQQGVLVEHDCPAMFACASILAAASDSSPESCFDEHAPKSASEFI